MGKTPRSIFQEDRLDKRLHHLFDIMRFITSRMEEVKADYYVKILRKSTYRTADNPTFVPGFYVLEIQYHNYKNELDQKIRVAYKLRWGRANYYDSSAKIPIVNKYIEDRLVINWRDERNESVKRFKKQILEFDKKVATLNQAQVKIFDAISALRKALDNKTINWIDRIQGDETLFEVLEKFPKAIHPRNKKKKDEPKVIEFDDFELLDDMGEEDDD